MPVVGVEVSFSNSVKLKKNYKNQVYVPLWKSL